MNELKLCKCGKIPVVFCESKNHIFGIGIGIGCTIGCTNIFCDQPLLIRYGFTKEQAERRAIKAWNRRCE